MRGASLLAVLLLLTAEPAQPRWFGITGLGLGSGYRDACIDTPIHGPDGGYLDPSSPKSPFTVRLLALNDLLARAANSSSSAEDLATAAAGAPDVRAYTYNTSYALFIGAQSPAPFRGFVMKAFAGSSYSGERLNMSSPRLGSLRPGPNAQRMGDPDAAGF